MHVNSLELMQKFVKEHMPDKNLKILDLGSRTVGRETRTYRQFFTNSKWEYVGADTEAGNNVDVVIEPYNFPFENDTFDVIISGQTIEHIEFPWVWFKEVARVLKKGGICCIIAPAVIHEHKYPIDTYRYYPDGMRALAKWSDLRVVDVKRSVVDKGMEDTYLVAAKS